MTTPTPTTTPTDRPTGVERDRRPGGNAVPAGHVPGSPERAPWSPADTVAAGDGHLRGEPSLCVGEAA